MKKHMKFIGLALALLLALFGTCSSFAVTPAPTFSPAMQVLAKELRMEKSGLLQGDISFSATDFDQAAGMDTVAGITLLSLPDPAIGCLCIGEKPVDNYTTLPRSALSELCFIPCCTVPASCSFTYGMVGAAEQYEVTCSLHLLSGLNFAPTVAAENGKEVIATYAGITCYGKMEGNDPEGDALHYELTSYPRKGITVWDGTTGEYRYIPTGNYVGNDRFGYVSIDRYGNRSEETTVQVKIEKEPTGVFYEDLREHPAGVAALTLAAKGIMTGEALGGSYLFRPDESISREEFAAVLLSAMEIEPSGRDLSVFADGREATSLCAPYLAEAANRGWLTADAGNEGEQLLRPGDPITLSEASRLLDAITGTPTDPNDTETNATPLTRGTAAIRICALLQMG